MPNTNCGRPLLTCDNAENATIDATMPVRIRFACRHGHAFRKQEEFLIALSGSFDVVVDDGTGEKRYHMSRSYYGLYLPAMTWRSIDNFATNSMVLVLSSTDYDPDDYIRDFELFKQMKL